MSVTIFMLHLEQKNVPEFFVIFGSTVPLKQYRQGLCLGGDVMWYACVCRGHFMTHTYVFDLYKKI